jgi:hypothetical protein
VTSALAGSGITIAEFSQVNLYYSNPNCPAAPRLHRAAR